MPQRTARSRHLRTRFAFAFGAVVALTALNVGVFTWGASERSRVFRQLRTAIERQSALTEARTGLEDHARRVGVVVQLIGAEHVPMDARERERALASVDTLRRRVAAATEGDLALATARARTDSLAAAWSRFYERQGAQQEQAIVVAVTRAEPLARRLLNTDLPAAIRREHNVVEATAAAFVSTERTTSVLAWTILALSVAASVGLVYRLSRDLLVAMDVLRSGAERFGAGELEHRVSVTACDELAVVGESLNAMAKRLQTARKELERRNEELAHLAFRDPLTGLANRALFHEQVETALANRGGRPEEMAILFLDLDDFKSVNDTLGHIAGDRLLRAVARRLLEATRTSDTVARLGGDEFAVLLHRVRDLGEAVFVAERVLWTMRVPFYLDARPIHITPSIGVVQHHHGESSDELLRNADVAMYRAKAAGKGRYEVFAPEMHTALLDRVELAAELREALDRGALSLVYQPIVDLADRRVTAFEALVRWPHSRRGPVPPALFIPIAEETGSIVALGRWVMTHACREAARWQLAAGDDAAGDGAAVGVSVNVSGRQLDDPGFVREVRHALDASGLPAACLTLEITETVIMRDDASTLDRLRELQALGVRVAIDDFGTGYSSLAYLQRFPVDTLKIDKVFVEQIARGGNETALARTIVGLGDLLRLRTVAEGIEDAEQHAELHALGCGFGQGYFFSRPLDADAAAAFLARGPADDLTA